MDANEPALSLVAGELACPDADVGQYIQDIDDNDVQDLDYSLAVQDYIIDNGQILVLVRVGLVDILWQIQTTQLLGFTRVASGC